MVELSDEYRAYIGSHCWRVKRELVIDERAFCACCRMTTEESKEQFGHGLDAHHLRGRWGREERSDLLVLCRGCHRIVHGQESTKSWHAIWAHSRILGTIDSLFYTIFFLAYLETHPEKRRECEARVFHSLSGKIPDLAAGIAKEQQVYAIVFGEAE